VRIGDVVLAFELGAAAGAPTAASAGVAANWEAELWDDDYGDTGGQDRGKKLLVWGLVGVIAVLIVAVGVGAALLPKGDATSTPVADATSVIVVVASATPEQALAQPTESSVVDLPTVAVDPIPTVAIDTGAIKPPAPPVNVPVSPENLEALPAMISQFPS
jgi:hypothetical protein